MTPSIVRPLITLLAAVAFLGLSADVARAQFTPYDDFSSGVIDPERWSGSSVEGGGASPTGAVIRHVLKAKQGSLVLGLESHGRTDTDTGVVVTRQQLNIRQLTPFITGLQAKVTMLDASAEDCAANSTGGSSSARLLAIFFNDGTSPDPATSAVGNVLAMLALQRNTDQTNTIVAYLYRCTSADCNAAAGLPGSPLTFTTRWFIGKAVSLTVVWDQAQQRVVYTAGAGAGAETRAIAYSVSDTDPPAGFDNKQVRVSNFAENCTTGRKRNAAQALFDDVLVQRAP